MGGRSRLGPPIPKQLNRHRSVRLLLRRRLKVLDEQVERAEGAWLRGQRVDERTSRERVGEEPADSRPWLAISYVELRGGRAQLVAGFLWRSLNPIHRYGQRLVPCGA